MAGIAKMKQEAVNSPFPLPTLTTPHLHFRRGQFQSQVLSPIWQRKARCSCAHYRQIISSHSCKQQQQQPRPQSFRVTVTQWSKSRNKQSFSFNVSGCPCSWQRDHYYTDVWGSQEEIASRVLRPPGGLANRGFGKSDNDCDIEEWGAYKFHLQEPRFKRADVDLHHIRATELVLPQERLTRHSKTGFVTKSTKNMQIKFINKIRISFRDYRKKLDDTLQHRGQNVWKNETPWRVNQTETSVLADFEGSEVKAVVKSNCQTSWQSSVQASHGRPVPWEASEVAHQHTDEKSIAPSRQWHRRQNWCRCLGQCGFSRRLGGLGWPNGLRSWGTERHIFKSRKWVYAKKLYCPATRKQRWQRWRIDALLKKWLALTYNYK